MLLEIYCRREKVENGGDLTLIDIQAGVGDKQWKEGIKESSCSRTTRYDKTMAKKLTEEKLER